MKPSIAIGGGAAALVLVAVAAGAMYQSLDVTHSQYGTYADAETAGMFDAGWLPRYLPRSAFEISETHNIDTNRVQATFRYRVGDTRSAEVVCKSIQRSAVGTTYTCTADSESGRLFLGSDGHGSYMSPGDGV
jgi:hypothetical protein